MSDDPPPNPPDDLRDVPPTVLAMADRVVLRMHKLIDGAPLALVVNAYRAGYAHGRQEAAAAIRAADTSGWPGCSQSEVDRCQELAARIADLPEMRRD